MYHPRHYHKYKMKKRGRKILPEKEDQELLLQTHPSIQGHDCESAPNIGNLDTLQTQCVQKLSSETQSDDISTRTMWEWSKENCDSLGNYAISRTSHPSSDSVKLYYTKMTQTFGMMGRIWPKTMKSCLLRNVLLLGILLTLFSSSSFLVQGQPPPLPPAGVSMR